MNSFVQLIVMYLKSKKCFQKKVTYINNHDILFHVCFLCDDIFLRKLTKSYFMVYNNYECSQFSFHIFPDLLFLV